MADEQSAAAGFHEMNFISLDSLKNLASRCMRQRGGLLRCEHQDLRRTPFTPAVALAVKVKRCSLPLLKCDFGFGF